MKAARLSEREDALDPAVSFVAFGALASLAPEHSEPNHALAKVIGRLYALFCQKKKRESISSSSRRTNVPASLWLS